MNDNHIASLYGAIRILEAVANDEEVTLGDIHGSINDLYAVINAAAPSSSSANGGKADPMIFKFSDYHPVKGNNNPRVDA